MPPPTIREYAVFISYRHLDNLESGRQWANWLHQALETYEIPADLVGTLNKRGEPIPQSLFPVFRDEAELPAGSDLKVGIAEALDRSRLLVVVCSPRAVQSEYVSNEILYFKNSGKADCILALIVCGEPNASWDQGKNAAGLGPELECFPATLQHPVTPDGRIDFAIRIEPIAADVRPQGRAEEGFTTAVAYQEFLESGGGLSRGEIRDKVRGYEAQLALAFLKIVSGALGVALGDLTDRDKVHQLTKARRRARVLRNWLAAVSVLTILATVAGWGFFRQKEQADRERDQKETQRRLAVEAGHTADLSRQEEARQRAEADRQRASAEEHTREETRQRAVAEQNAKAAEEARQNAERNLAKVSVQRAADALADSDPDVARTILKTVPPRFREWEWYFLAAWSGPSALPMADFPPDTPFADQIAEFKKRADPDAEQPKLPDPLAKTEPFTDPGQVWMSPGGCFLGMAGEFGGRTGGQSMVFRADPVSFLDSFHAGKYGERPTVIPSADGTVAYCEGDFSEAWSNRRVTDKSLLPLPDCFGITRRLNSVLQGTYLKGLNEYEEELVENGKARLDAAFRPVASSFLTPGAFSALSGVESIVQLASFTEAREKPRDKSLSPKPPPWRLVREIDGAMRVRAVFRPDDNMIGGGSCLADEALGPFLERRRKAAKNVIFVMRSSWIEDGKLFCLLATCQPGSSPVKPELTCWDVKADRPRWKRTLPGGAMYYADAAVSADRKTALICLPLETISLADGSTLKQLDDGAPDYFPNPSVLTWYECTYSPDGRYAAFTFSDRNDRGFALWNATTGALLAKDFSDDDETTPAPRPSLEGERLGKKTPNLLQWERSSPLVAVQKLAGDDLMIYKGLDGREVARIPNLHLDAGSTPFTLFPRFNRVQIGRYLLDATTWEPLLTLPEGSIVLDEGRLVAVPLRDGRVEFVHLPAVSVGGDRKAARTLREFLLCREFGL